MPKNKIDDLRNLLFETIERLMDDDDSMDVERAKSIADVAQVIVNTAKAEIAFIEAVGADDTGFMTVKNTAEPKQLDNGRSSNHRQ